MLADSIGLPQIITDQYLFQLNKYAWSMKRKRLFYLLECAIPKGLSSIMQCNHNCNWLKMRNVSVTLSKYCLNQVQHLCKHLSPNSLSVRVFLQRSLSAQAAVSTSWISLFWRCWIDIGTQNVSSAPTVTRSWRTSVSLARGMSTVKRISSSESMFSCTS